MPGETVPYIYTTEAEIQSLFGAEAVTLLTDDNQDGTGDSTLSDAACLDATDYINLYCSLRYNESDMVNNQWVRRQATYLAAYFLSMRRGNPQRYLSAYERITAVLERINRGELMIPRLPTRSDYAPGVTNYRVDDRFHVNKTRVQPTITSGTDTGDQDLDVNYPYEGPIG